MEPARIAASVVSIVAAFSSMTLSWQRRPAWGIVVAVLGVLIGLCGFLWARTSRVSGGVLSLGAIVLGGLAALFALLAAMS